MAASLGGDTDTIAAILGAMLGACMGLAVWPTILLIQIRKINTLELEPLVEGLLTLRSR